MDQASKAKVFRDLHVPGNPVVLYNIWDVGSAKAVAGAGAKALATGSWSVADAQGYADGEHIPKEELFALAAKISAQIDLPLSVDFEGGYAIDPDSLRANVSNLIASGAIGLNFEDQVVGGQGLHPLDSQIERIAAIRGASSDMSVQVFINARTDLFLKESDVSKHGALVDLAIERGQAFAKAGADGFFVPWLVDIDLIARICANVPLPVNVMMRAGMPAKADLAAAGVARISHGPGPYRQAMADLAAKSREAMS